MTFKMSVSRTILIFSVFLCFYVLNSDAISSLRRHGKHGALGLPRVSHIRKRFQASRIPAQFFQQKLDHFNPQSTATWQQRYFMRDDHWNGTGPVFLQLGGEGAADPIWLVQGQIAEALTQRFSAYNIYLEHRYYGKSYPTSNMSTENLQYLTSEQSLADFANFIQQYTTQNPELAKVPWIAFGGSYSGSLAAWLKLKYPHLITGSIASSAPLLAEIDFLEYQNVVRDSIGSQCTKRVQTAVSQVQKLLEHPMGWRTLTKDFNLCTDLVGTDQQNVNNFLASLVDVVDGVVQYSNDNRQFEGANPITIEQMCDVMTNDSSNQLELVRFSQVNKMVLDTMNLTCLDYDYNEMIAELRNVSWESSAAEGGRQWTYQTCVEFGFFQTTDSPDEPFYNLIPSDFFQNQCVDIFGPQFNGTYLTKAVADTNTYYGAKRLRADRVLLPNGSIDPWHALGLTDFTYETSRSLYINGTAHCADLYPTSNDDLDTLVQARQVISDYVYFLVSTSD